MYCNVRRPLRFHKGRHRHPQVPVASRKTTTHVQDPDDQVDPGAALLHRRKFRLKGVQWTSIGWLQEAVEDRYGTWYRGLWERKTRENQRTPIEQTRTFPGHRGPTDVWRDKEERERLGCKKDASGAQKRRGVISTLRPHNACLSRRHDVAKQAANEMALKELDKEFFDQRIS